MPRAVVAPTPQRSVPFQGQGVAVPSADCYPVVVGTNAHGIEKKEPARMMNIDEARGKIVKGYQQDLINNMIAKLRLQFPVVINEEQLKKVSK